MSVPIIGQPKIGDWFFAFAVTCTCGHPFLVKGKPGPESTVRCKCGLLYRLLGMPTANELGEISVPLGSARAVES